jgi:transcription termination/antitermination protein NusA
MSAIQQICEEKNISYEAVLETIQAALAAAYRKDFGNKNLNLKVEYNPETNETKVFDVKTVVEDISEEELVEAAELRQKEKEGQEIAEEEIKKFNPKTEIMISEAKKIKKKIKVGEEIVTPLEIPAAYGRMAAQTAKQVIIQRIREAERDTIYNDFKAKENTLINGLVQRREGRLVLIDLNQTVGILPPEEQIEGENYYPGRRLKVYITGVNLTAKGPEVVVSRSHPEIVRELFRTEVPEISAETVEIKSIAREAGIRSKIAVFSKQPNIDPVGSCVGQRGSRVQTIINELEGEKIDIIEWSEDEEKFISNALSPAKVMSIELNNENKTAVVRVKPDQYSLAIGRAGQNVRLAAKLTGWRIDVEGGEMPVEEKIEESEEIVEDDKKEVVEEKKEEKKAAAKKKKKKDEKESDEVKTEAE